MVKTSLASDIAVLSPPRVNELIPITVPPFCASSLLSFSKSPSSPTQGLQVVNQKLITVTLLDEKMSSLLTSFPSRSLPLKLGNFALLQEQNERMSQMTKTLLEMSELRTVECKDTIEIAPMIEEIFTDLAPLAEKKNIRLEYNGNGRMIGSDTLIYRLLFNLTENAIRYNRENASVIITVDEKNNQLYIRVKDNGYGIPEQYRESIFQPFFRVDKSRSRAYGGVGLGLSLVWEIVLLHNGTVKAEKSDKNGTVMLVTLPKKQTNN